MRVEFLGTGGAVTTPQPNCPCPVCMEARTKGVPYSRSGPSTFVHGPDALIDTPEEIKDELNRSQVRAISAGFYSHWHPDHVLGRRVWEMNHDWRGWPPCDRCTPIYIPERVAADFRVFGGTWEALTYMAKNGWIQLIVLRDGDSAQLGSTRVTPIQLAVGYVYAFLFEDARRRILVVADELLGWEPPESLQGLDLAVVPVGVMEFHPLTGRRQYPADHPELRQEATFKQTLDIVRALRARHVVFSHFEEPDGLSYDEHRVLERRLRDDGLNVTMAYDGLVVDVR